MPSGNCNASRYIDAVLLDVESEPVLGLHTGGAEQGSYGSRGPALLANNLAEIGLGDSQAQQGCFALGHRFDLDLVGMIH